MPKSNLKIEAARIALGYVEDGMKLGIGTGSTANEFIRLLGDRVAAGLRIVGVPTSERTEILCRELAIPLTTLDDQPRLDLVVDGADEISPDLSLIKGGGGALLREKIVAHAASRMVVIADESKLVPELGRFPLPIEVNFFGLRATETAIREAADRLGLSGPVSLRVTQDGPFVTDGGHAILDASFGRIPDTRALSDALFAVPGVVEHGMFLGLANAVIIAGNDGVKTLHAPRSLN